MEKDKFHLEDEEYASDDVEMFEEVAGSVESFYDLDDDDDAKVFSVKNVLLTVLISIVAAILVFTIMGAIEMACYKTTGVIDNDYIVRYDGVENVKAYTTKITNLLNNDLKARGLKEEDVADNDVTDAIVEEWYQEWAAIASEARTGFNEEYNRASAESQSDNSDEYTEFYDYYARFLEELSDFTEGLTNSFSGNTITQAYSNKVTNYKIYHYEYPTNAERKIAGIKDYNDAKEEVIKALEKVLSYFDNDAIYKQI